VVSHDRVMTNQLALRCRQGWTRLGCAPGELPSTLECRYWRQAVHAYLRYPACVTCRCLQPERARAAAMIVAAVMLLAAVATVRLLDGRVLRLSLADSCLQVSRLLLALIGCLARVGAAPIRACTLERIRRSSARTEQSC
jgi:hypothetical protein